MQALIAALQRNMWQALRSGDLVEAEAILERLKREDPLSVHTRGFELDLLLRTRRHDEAAALAGQLVEAFPDSARIYFLAAQAEYRLKNYQRAARLLRESLRITPHWRTRQWLGKTLTQLGRFAEAEAILTELVIDHPRAGQDLGWLYERMQDEDRAMAALEAFLKVFPDDEYVTAQLERLRARSLGSDRLQQEVESLLELGEEVPPNLLPDYVDSLLRSGRGQEARKLVAEIEEGLEPAVATRIAWNCHRLQAYDLALRLFMSTLLHNVGNVKHLTALESDALRCNRGHEVVALYRSHAGDEPRLWGRMRALLKRMNRGR